MCDQQRLRSACAYAQSDQRLYLSLEHSMTIKLLTEHHWEFLNLKGGCTGLYESTLVKMPHCWKSHVAARIVLVSLIMILIWHRSLYFLHGRLFIVTTKKPGGRTHRNIPECRRWRHVFFETTC